VNSRLVRWLSRSDASGGLVAATVAAVTLVALSLGWMNAEPPDGRIAGGDASDGSSELLTMLPPGGPLFLTRAVSTGGFAASMGRARSSAFPSTARAGSAEARNDADQGGYDGGEAGDDVREVAASRVDDAAVAADPLIRRVEGTVSSGRSTLMSERAIRAEALQKKS